MLPETTSPGGSGRPDWSPLHAREAPKLSCTSLAPHVTAPRATARYASSAAALTEPATSGNALST